MISPPLLSAIINAHTFYYGSSQEQDCQKKTAVVLLSSNGKTGAGSEGVSVTTLCTDVLPAPKHGKPRDWLTLIRPLSVNMRPGSPLRFSLSLNDVGQRVDSLCRGLRFIDRTCSEGELELKAEPAPPSSSRRPTQMLNGKLTPAPAPHNPYSSSTPTPPHLVPSFTNNYKYTPGNPPVSPSDPTIIAPPLLSVKPHSHRSPSSGFLRILFPFSHSPTSASLQCSELGSYTSHLHIAKSSSALEDGELGFPTEELLVDEDIGEEDQISRAPEAEAHQTTPATVTKAGAAPLCYMDEDSDLDPYPLTEKSGPQSPYSLSGDCCRWVTGCLDGIVHTHPSSDVVEPRKPPTWQSTLESCGVRCIQ